MRDVDLFVGVASVGNDPTWQDGGPEGRYRDYWHAYSFGELSGTAATRKQVLERLVPRLKIADRCSFADRFLVVRGQKRTYKIHLGSGNILMEPNDQYLCIVPDSRSQAEQDDLFLPFEGDNTLSIILSKALLLADDTKIKDPTITARSTDLNGLRVSPFSDRSFLKREAFDADDPDDPRRNRLPATSTTSGRSSSRPSASRSAS